MNFTFLALAVLAITVFGSKLDVLLNVLEEKLAEDSADFPTSPNALEEELAIALEEELAGRSWRSSSRRQARTNPRASAARPSMPRNPWEAVKFGVDFRKFEKNRPKYFTPTETNEYGKKDYKIDLGLGTQTVAKEPGNAHVISLKVVPSMKHTVGAWQCDDGWYNHADGRNKYTPNGKVSLYMFTTYSKQRNKYITHWSAQSQDSHHPSEKINCRRSKFW